MNEGMIHIYCGDGKGKTTAAIGLLVRAAGRGFPTVLARFLKGADSGEVCALSHVPGCCILKTPETVKFTFSMDEAERAACRKEMTAMLDEAADAVRRSKAGLLVLDEVLDAVATGMLDEVRLEEFLRMRPENLEVVMTGRGPTTLTEPLADYITVMEKVRHPYDSGLRARWGIEY